MKTFKNLRVRFHMGLRVGSMGSEVYLCLRVSGLRTAVITVSRLVVRAEDGQHQSDINVLITVS